MNCHTLPNTVSQLWENKDKRGLKEGFAALPSETVGLDAPMNDFRSCFLELLSGNPHLLEGLQ